MKRKHVFLPLWFGLSALVVSACLQEGTDPLEVGELIPVELAFSLQGGSSATKADVSSLTELAGTAMFRGMEDIRTLPFSETGGVRSGNVAIGEPRSLPSISNERDTRAHNGSSYHKGLIKNNHAHLYPDSYGALPLGTASVLVYGFAPRASVRSTLQQELHLNGSLILNGWEDLGRERTAADITFDPDPIYSGETAAEGAVMANEIASILSAIVAGCSYTQSYWYKQNDVWKSGSIAVRWDASIDDPTLQNYFTWITGNGQVMTGAGQNLQYMLTVLNRGLQAFESSNDQEYMHVIGGIEYPALLEENGPALTYAHLYDGLRDVILDHFHEQLNDSKIDINDSGVVVFSDSDLRDFPRQLGMPAGAAVLRWNGTQFTPITEGGLDGIAPLNRFCYMPPLCYFVNTTLSTSEIRDLSNYYTSDTESWSAIVGQYRGSKVVGRTTAAVALDDPLQYACAMMCTTVRAEQEILQDGDGDERTYCSATGTNFPVTGLLLGGQFKQNFDFTPDGSGAEYYLYDDQVSGVYLTTSESADFRTLVLPSLPDRDIYFFLELRNDSGVTFTGAEGDVLPGNYFYLAGKLEESSDPELPRIFMQDHFTTVRCVVSSLENAHLSVPDIGEPQVVFGVRTDIQWIMSASSYVVLD